jgi:RNA polymerase sigma-70 factor (ECF subfamily)
MTLTLHTAPTIEQIVRTHQRDVWRFLMALGCDATEAEDLAQEAFVQALRNFEYRSEHETAAWLRKAAKNLFITTVRKRKRAPVVRNLDDVDVEWATWSEGLAHDTRIEHLKRCLETLAERARAALDLRYRDNLGREEMAARLQMKEAGVKTLLERARAALRECVEKRTSHDQ